MCNQPVGVVFGPESGGTKRTLPSTAANKPIAVSLDSMVNHIIINREILKFSHSPSLIPLSSSPPITERSEVRDIC